MPTGEFHIQQEKATAAGHPVIDLPFVNSGYPADLLSMMHSEQKEHEIIYSGRKSE